MGARTSCGSARRSDQSSDLLSTKAGILIPAFFVSRDDSKTQKQGTLRTVGTCGRIPEGGILRPMAANFSTLREIFCRLHFPLLFASLAIQVFRAHAQDGSLDPSFNPGSGVDQFVSSIAI